MTYSFDNLPPGSLATPQHVLPLAQAQAQLMTNSYFPSIMRSLGFDAAGDGIRQMVQQDDRYTQATRDAQDAEADGDNAVWYLDRGGVPVRRGIQTSAPWGMTGRQASAILRQRASAYAPAPQPQQQPSYKTMSMADFWGQQ